MSIEASSEQSYVCEGMGYNDVYLWGQDNIGAPYLESVLSTNSPPEEEKEDSDVDGSESTSGDSDSKESIENVESPIRFVIGLNGLRNFFYPSCGRLMISTQLLSDHTSTPFGRDIRFPSAFPSI